MCKVNNRKEYRTTESEGSQAGQRRTSLPFGALRFAVCLPCLVSVCVRLSLAPAESLAGGCRTLSRWFFLGQFARSTTLWRLTRSVLVVQFSVFPPSDELLPSIYFCTVRNITKLGLWRWCVRLSFIQVAPLFQTFRNCLPTTTPQSKPPLAPCNVCGKICICLAPTPRKSNSPTSGASRKSMCRYCTVDLWVYCI